MSASPIPSPESPGPVRNGPVRSGLPRWRPAKDWRELLVGRRPEDVLERIMADDPLRLRALAGQRIRATARFLDADRVVLRSMARIAHGVTLDGPPDDRTWIAAEVEAALDDVQQAERSAIRALDRGADPVGTDSAGPFDVLTRQLHLSGNELRRACDAFNRRTSEERSAFFALFVESCSVDDAARLCSVSVTEVARRARRALEAMLDATSLAGDGVEQESS